jgi:CBS domain containing-hemolysin-like protein
VSAGVGIPLTAALLLLNAFFVGAEFALVSARRASIEPRAEGGSRRAISTLRAMEHVSLMLAGAQLGITVCSLALGAVSEPVIAHLLEPAFDATGLPADALHPLAFAVAILLITVLHVVIGEMVPKNIALAGPEAAALWLGPPLAGVVRALKPLIWLLNQAANLTLRAVRVQPRDEVVSAFTRDEVAGLVEQSHREGLLDPGERDLLSGALAFETATAMVLTLPLDRVHTLPPNPSANDVEQLAARTGVTRFPILDVDAGGRRLTGYVHLKDTLTLAAADRDRPLPAAIIRALPDVAPDQPLAEAIDIMRTSSAHLARVTVAGQTVGVITLDDILANLVQP